MALHLNLITIMIKHLITLFIFYKYWRSEVLNLTFTLMTNINGDFDNMKTKVCPLTTRSHFNHVRGLSFQTSKPNCGNCRLVYAPTVLSCLDGGSVICMLQSQVI